MSQKKTNRIIACSVDNTESLANADNWQKVVTIGNWKGHSQGAFEITLKDLERMAENFKKLKIQLVADYEHQTLSGDKAEAAGWITDTKVEDSALWAKIEWLDDAKELIKAKKYRYLSPVIVPYTIDQVSGEDIGWSLHSVALTNKPFFEELGEVFVNSIQVQNKEENILNEEQLAELEKLRDENKKLREELQALKEEKAEVQVDAAVAAKKVHPDQKESLLAFSANDPDGFAKFLASAKPIASKPGEDDAFAANQNHSAHQKYDVLKLGGIE